MTMNETAAPLHNKVSSKLLPPPFEGDMCLLLNKPLSMADLQPIEVVPIVAAGIVFSILAVIGTVATAIFIAVLIKGRSKFAEYPFFVLVWHMTVANAIHMLMVISTIMPIMLLESEKEPLHWDWYVWGSRILRLSEQAVLYFTLLMTVNRFAVFVFPRLLVAFTYKRVVIFSCLTWFYVIFIVTWNGVFGASWYFSKGKLVMENSILGNNLLTKFFTLSSTVLPIVMLAMYGIIFVNIIRKREAWARYPYEKDRSLLWQALAVTVMLELTKLTSMITPYMSVTDTWVQWCWTIFSYSTSVLNQMANPVLFLTMNKMIQSVLRSFFRTGVDQFNSGVGNPIKATQTARCPWRIR